MFLIMPSRVQLFKKSFTDQHFAHIMSLYLMFGNSNSNLLLFVTTHPNPTQNAFDII